MPKTLFNPIIVGNGILWIVGIAMQIGGWVNHTIALILLVIAFLWSIIYLVYWLKNRHKKPFESPINWIDDYKNRHRKLPPLPDYLLGVVNYYTSGEPISKGIQPITPSGQWWNSRVPSEQKQWRQLVEWLGLDPEDLLAHMRMMLPKNPDFSKRK